MFFAAGIRGGQSRPPLRTLSLRGAKRRGNPFPARRCRADGTSGTPSPTKSRECVAKRDGQSRPPLRTLSLRGAKRRGNPFPARRCRADGTSYPKGICSAALHCRTPCPTRGSTYRPVGRGPCAPPPGTHFLAGHMGPALQGAAVIRAGGGQKKRRREPSLFLLLKAGVTWP